MLKRGVFFIFLLLLSAFQIGSMSDVFGTVVSGVQIAKPPPPVSDTTAWQAYTVEQESAASNGISGLVPIYIPDRMESAGPTKGDTSYEGKPFTVTPTFKIMDSQVLINSLCGLRVISRS